MRLSREKAIEILEENGCPERVIRHCLAVERKALEIAKDNDADVWLVSIGAILHDIGRSREQGVSHGIVGAEIARSLGLDERIVRIIERHVGSGITKDEAVSLGLGERDLCPRTIEEKIVSLADNLVDEDKVISFEQALSGYIGKFGEDSGVVKRLKALEFELCRGKGSNKRKEI